jgi:glyoxylase-like metal-dependent hydrolase (beta-lactamase superfamily II)
VTQVTDLTPLGNRPEFEGGLQEVAPRTYAWIQPNGDLGESNAGLVIGDRESLLIDTLWDERLTRRMLDVMFPHVRDAPIGTVFNTHGDGDHWYGNGVVLNVEVVATEAAEKQMHEEPPAMIARTAPLRIGAGVLGRIPLFPFGDRIRGMAAGGRALNPQEKGGGEPPRPPRSV